MRIFLFFNIWIGVCITSLRGQYVRSAESIIWDNAIYYLEDNAVDSVTYGRISQFVMKEANRFRMTLHPAFAKLDSLAPKGSERRAQLEQNPYAIFPTLADYTYIPIFRIVPFERTNNLYWVEVSDCFVWPEGKKRINRERGYFYKKNIISTSASINSDTFFFRHSYPYRNYLAAQRPNFFENDGLYAVFYSKRTGELRMIGGNAFLEQLPKGAIHYDPATDERFSSLFACLRLVHFTCDFPMEKKMYDPHLSSNLTNDSLASPIDVHVYDPNFHPYVYIYRNDYGMSYYPSKIHSPYHQDEYVYSYRDIIRVKVGLPELDSIPEGYAMAESANHVTWEEVQEMKKKYPIVRLPSQPWSVQLKYYTQRLHPALAGLVRQEFPVYEVLYDILENPTCYEQVLPQIRGLTMDEWEYMKKQDRRLMLNKGDW